MNNLRRFLVTVGLLLAVGLRAAESQRLEIGPEELVSTAPAGVAQMTPTAIWDGSAYLVAWSETSVGGLAGQVRAVRFGGDVANAPESVLRATPNDQRFPAASFNGQNTLIVWVERETPAAKTATIYGARVANGAGLSPGAFVISSDAEFDSLAISWDGVNHLVAWPSASTKQIIGTRVSPSGFLVDPVPFAISPVATFLGDHEPSISWNGQSYLVAWSARVSGGCQLQCYLSARVEGRLVLASGTASGEKIFLSPLPGRRPSVTSSGLGFLVVYIADPFVLRATRVTNDGISLDSSLDRQGFAIRTSGGASSAVVVWDGEDYLVGIQGVSPVGHLYLARLSREATVLEPLPTHVSVTIIDQPRPIIVPRSPALSTIFYQRAPLEAPIGGAPRIFARSIVSDESQNLNRRRAARR